MMDMSHDHKLSCRMGNLYPVFNEDCIPGDRWRISNEALIRFAPLVAPMMHLVNVFFHTFFVPWRLLWPNFENHMTGQKVGGIDPAIPYIILNDGSYGATGGLFDHLGIPNPNDAVGSTAVNAYQMAAYAFIWNEYYRDQRLMTPLDFALIDGNNSANIDLQSLQRRCWEHDYLTSGLPSPQAVDGVNVPLGDVELKDPWFPTDSGDNPVFRNTVGVANAGALANTATGVTVAAGGTYAYDPEGTLQVAPTSIRNLRLAFKLQEFLERQNVSGNRYTEFNYGMFGVRGQDARLQRPEYVGGSRSPVRISEVLNTTGTDDLPQANMAGHGISVTNGNNSSYFVQEHGTIMTLMSVMPKTAYFQGVPRKFLKTFDRYQYYFQQFENIGDQEVKNREVHVEHADPNGTFNYGPRYMEYKTAMNRVSGQFKTSLLHWHMARDLSAAVDFNEEFLKCDPTSRIFAATGEDDNLFCHVYNKAFAKRLMSKYSTPHIV